MFLKANRRNRKLRRGSVITPGVFFGGVVGLGVAALAVDTGLMFSAKQELRNAADAAALAAASQLGTPNATTDAVVEAARIAGLNNITHQGADLVDSDVIFGRATLNNGRYEFNANQTPYDAVSVTLRRDSSVADGPVSMLFGQALGVEGADLSATAVAMVVPRDIAVVIDTSGSMNDDSELRHYKDFASESSGTRPGVQINLEQVWMSLPCQKGNNGVGNGIDPQPPGNPGNVNDQPGTGPGSPNSQGGNPSPGASPTGPNGGCGGPRWGWMTGFGNAVTLGSYTPVGDPGLYYIPKSVTCSDTDVIANLTESGYSSAERTALLSGSNDGTTQNYRNRVKVLLGLAGWKSKKSGGKYNGGPGNGDNKVDNNELTQVASYPFSGGSWDAYVDYMTNASEMRDTDPNFRYRFGIKTFVNYLLEKQANNANCPELAAAPEEPLHSVKGAVQALVDTVVELETDDRMSLEAFAQYGYHRVNLQAPAAGQTLAEVLQQIPNNLNGMQAGHFTSITNIGAGLHMGITELSSDRARASAAKVVVLMTDGKPNVNQQNQSVGNNAASAISWCYDRANAAKAAGMTVYVVGVGGDVDADLCSDLASTPDHYFFADSTPDPDNGFQPMYVNQLRAIFETLGGKRPVRLIQ